MKTALQIYTLRDALGADDIRNTLSRVRSMGYDGVEWFGLLGYTAEQIAEMTTAAGLEMFSLHIDYTIAAAADRAFLRDAAAIGVKYLPIGWLPENRIAGGVDFEETCEVIRSYAALAKEHGLYVLYHNHDFDLALHNGTPKLDLLFDAIDADLFGAEPDTCWLYSGHVDPVAYLKKYSDRAPVIHLKDCVAEGGRAGFRPLGMGVLNFAEILPACQKAEWLCVEQDDPMPGMDAFACAEASAKFLGLH